MLSPTCVSNLLLIDSIYNPETYQFIIEPTFEHFVSTAIVTDIVAIAYHMTDIIIFTVMEDIYSNNKIIEISMTINDISNDVITIPFDDMCSNILSLYNYTKSKGSIIVNNNNSIDIIGTHMLRRRDYAYSLIPFDINPIGKSYEYSLLFPTDEQLEIFAELNRAMIVVKRL